MLIPLTTTIAATIAMLALIVGAYWLATRVARGGGVSLGSWRWYPSPLALLILLPVAAFLLWHFSGALLIVPFILPFFWRRGLGNRFFAWARGGRRSNHRNEDDHPVDDQ